MLRTRPSRSVSRYFHNLRRRSLFLEPLESRQLLAALTDGNILVSSSPFDQPALLMEFTPEGRLIQSTEVPHPTRSSIDKARDIVVDRSGKVQIYNGSYDPRLTTYDPANETFSHTTFPTWNTNSNVTYGGITALNDFVYASDQQVRSELSTSRGVVRFNVENLQSGWNVKTNADIGDSAVNTSTFIPHLTVHGTGDKSVDYYSFTVTQPNSRGIFDIDRGDTGLAGSFHSALRIFDNQGTLLAQNNGDVPTQFGAGGSSGTGDAYLEYNFAQVGDYRIEVGACCPFAGIPEGSTYDLQISIQNHSLFVPAGSGELTEVEPNNTFFTPQNTDSAERLGTDAGSTMDVAMGLNGLLYALVYENSPTGGGRLVAEYDPGTLQLLRTITLPEEHRAIAVDGQGHIYAADPGLWHYDPAGNLLAMVESPISGILADLDIRSDGALLVASNSGYIALTNVRFDGVDFFQARQSNGSTFAAFVQSPLHLPKATDDEFRVVEDTNANLNVLINDLVDTRGLLVVDVVSSPDNGGNVSIVGGRSLRYSPASDFVGTETFTYTVRDGLGSTSTALVTVHVSNINESPIANPDARTVLEDAGATLINVLGNDTFAPDLDETLSITAVGNASAGGTVTIANSGFAVSYRPAANFAGTETFTYSISDGNGGSAEGLVTVTVLNINDNPTATSDRFNVLPNSGANTLDVLANDSSLPDGNENLDIVSVVLPQHGSAVVLQNKIIYTPAANYIGSDTLSYRISDRNGGFANATVQLVIGLINSPPTAVADFYNVRFDSSGHKLLVLSNDSTAPDANETLTIVDVGTPDRGGIASIASDNSIRYSPAFGFVGTETFNYTVSDGHSGSAVALVTIQVGDFNSSPVANNDNFIIQQNVVDKRLDVLANDLDPDADLMRITAAPTASLRGGAVAISSDGSSLIYSAPSPFAGSDRINYTISDRFGGTSSAVAFLSITGWQNPEIPLDVDANLCIDNVDAIILINEINHRSISDARGLLPFPPLFITNFYDPSGEGYVTALDALDVINELNHRGSSGSGCKLSGGGGEGEAEGEFVSIAYETADALSSIEPPVGRAPSKPDAGRTLADVNLQSTAVPKRAEGDRFPTYMGVGGLDDVIDLLAKDVTKIRGRRSR